MRSPETSRRSILKLGFMFPVLLLNKSSSEPEREIASEVSFDERLISQVVESIKKEGLFECELSEMEAAELVKLVGNKKLQEEHMYGSKFTSSEVSINNDILTFNGKVNFPFAGSMDIDANLTQQFENEPVLDSLNMNASNEAVERILNKIGATKLVKNKLSKPYDTLLDYLNERTQPSGVISSEIQTEFTKNNTFAVLLRGKTTTPSS